MTTREFLVKIREEMIAYSSTVYALRLRQIDDLLALPDDSEDRPREAEKALKACRRFAEDEYLEDGAGDFTALCDALRMVYPDFHPKPQLDAKPFGPIESTGHQSSPAATARSIANCPTCNASLHWENCAMRDVDGWEHNHPQAAAEPASPDVLRERIGWWRRDVARPAKRDDGIPTRIDIRWQSDGEAAIRQAVHVIEAMGASVCLTEAVVLLQKAQELVADHVEDLAAARLGRKG